MSNVSDLHLNLQNKAINELVDIKLVKNEVLHRVLRQTVPKLCVDHIFQDGRQPPS